MMMGTTTSTLSTKRIVIFLRLWKTRRIISFGARDFGNCREKHKQNATMLANYARRNFYLGNTADLLFI
jgi:hypothetical protein